jgi:membrane-bound ClpP family serine protease
MSVFIMSMISGISFSASGLVYDEKILIMVGISVMAFTAVTWWFWVMFLIKTLMRFTENTKSNTVIIKDHIKTIRHLIKKLDK